MTQNQKWMKLGPGKGQPKAKSVRRLKARGASWIDAFRRLHEEKKNGGGNSGQHGNGTAG